MLAGKSTFRQLLFTTKPRVKETMRLMQMSGEPLKVYTHWRNGPFICGGEGCCFCGVTRKLFRAYIAVRFNSHDLLIEFSEPSYENYIREVEEYCDADGLGMVFDLHRPSQKRPYLVKHHRILEPNRRAVVDEKTLLLSVLRLYRIPVVDSTVPYEELVSEASANAIAISKVRA